MRIRWDRCDAINCKCIPVKLIEFRASPSILTGKIYDITVRVCQKHFEAEGKDPSMKLLKSRKGYQKQDSVIPL